MKYDIVDESIPMNENLSKWFIPFVIVLFLALPLSFLFPSSIMVTLLIISFAIGIVGHYYDSKPVHDINKTIGELSINEKYITIKYGQTISVNDIKSIVLISDFFQGKPNYNDNSSTGSTGITELKITDNLNEVTTIRFLIKRLAQFNYLKDVVRTYYISKISIKETSRLRTRTLLLEPLTSYAETQALKKELGI